MNNKIRKTIDWYRGLTVVAKATIAYTLASLFTKGLGIFTTPLFTRIMTTSEIGEFNTFSSWYSMIGVVATLSLSSGSFSLAMFEFKNERDQYASSILTLSSITAISTGVIYFINPEFWNKILALNTIEVTIMLLAFLLIPATDYRIVRLRYEYKYKTLIKISLINAVLGTVLAVTTVLLARHYECSNLAQYRIIGLYLVLCSMGVYNYIYIIKNGKTFLKKKFVMFVLLNNTPLIANAFAKHILEVSDRTMITNMIGKSQTGIYSTLYTVSTLSVIVWSAIEANLLPYMFDKLKNNKESLLTDAVKPLLVFFAGVCFLLTLVAPEIVKILATKEYYEAIYIMPPVACGVYFTAVYNIFGDVLLYHKKTYYIMLSTVIAATSNIILNYIGLKIFGYYAAAYTTLISYMILGLLQYFAMRKVHKGKVFDIKFIVLVSIVLVALSLICILLYDYYLVRYMVVLGIWIFIIKYRKLILSKISVIKKRGEDVG